MSLIDRAMTLETEGFGSGNYRGSGSACHLRPVSRYFRGSSVRLSSARARGVPPDLLAGLPSPKSSAQSRQKSSTKSRQKPDRVRERLRDALREGLRDDCRKSFREHYR